jgi:hypothetical protein
MHEQRDVISLRQYVPRMRMTVWKTNL